MRVRSLAGFGVAVLLALSATPASAMLRTLHTFCVSMANCRDGAAPAQLVADGAGNLYGTTQEFGARHGQGTIFELEGGRRFRLLYTFCEHGGGACPGGSLPDSQLIIDNAGNLYGVTKQGGAFNRGTAFELQPNALHTAWSLTKLYDFCGPGDASCPNQRGYPYAGLTYAGAASGAAYDGTSPLYGVISGGGDGPGLAGSVYALTPGTPWTTSLIYAFCQQGGNACTDGADPDTTLSMDAAGNLFGNTDGGGSAGAAVVFEISPPASGMDTWTYTVLYNFCSAGRPLCADGLEPLDHLTLGADGNLYGTTIAGGRLCRSVPLNGSSCGIIYKIVPNGTSSVETVLHEFCAKENCTDGARPVGGVAIDAAGNLYGTTQFGGTNPGVMPEGPGVLYVMEPISGGWRYKVLHQFCALADCSDGQLPQFAPIIANGALCGSTATTEFSYRPLP